MKPKIIWITAEAFIDVDLPIIPILSKFYKINWFICINKNSVIDNKNIISSAVNNTDVDVHYVVFRYRMRNPLSLLQYLKLTLRIHKTMPQIFYIDNLGAPYFLPLLRFVIDKNKIIIAVHNVSTPKGAINERFMEKYTKLILKLFKNFHVFSKNQKLVLQSKTKNKNILYAPLALKDYGKSINTADKKLITFLNFGFIREYKRIDVLIEAAQIAYEKTQKPFKVKIAGSCGNWEKYRKLIKYKFLFDTRIEPIPNEDVADLFSASHYFVLPYQDIAQSGAITVAFNYNLPVVASNLPSFKDVIVDGQTGYLFEPASKESLAVLMINIINNHKQNYYKLKEAQQFYINKNFSTHSIANKYREFFESL
ncbi:glycosyltransferase [uncultured Desulfobacter sp.]|uniref:glycosyltransferase family 4 protein n=1 Tax=uncultured Desulfobacter sp. TaxID=240139 RepID=UPI0029F45BD2|nr:glycosyltransferase [uncultured Desulfobacter sp.]